MNRSNYVLNSYTYPHLWILSRIKSEIVNSDIKHIFPPHILTYFLLCLSIESRISCFYLWSCLKCTVQCVMEAKNECINSGQPKVYKDKYWIKPLNLKSNKIQVKIYLKIYRSLTLSIDEDRITEHLVCLYVYQVL